MQVDMGRSACVEVQIKRTEVLPSPPTLACRLSPAFTGTSGDCEPDSVKAVASAFTPVPGGVGPMTVAMVVLNTVIAAERQSGKEQG